MNNERIIYILEYLQKNTDRKRQVTIKDIQAYLSSVYDMNDVSVLTVRRDIDSLIRAGYDIRTDNGAHNTYKYRLLSKGFTFNEIRFLVDSVSINKFLSDNQKQRLIKKFEGMCSDSDITRLISRIRLNSKASPSLDLLKNLEMLHTAISENRKVNFEYGKYDVTKNMIYERKRRELVPVKVIYFNERFYLRCYDEQRKDMRTYRVDRINKISLGERVTEHYEDKPYEGFVADMFPPESFEIVTLRVKRYLLDEMYEQLGDKISMRDDLDNEDCVIIRVTAGINKQFYLWVMRYGDGLEIISPQNVRNDMEKEVRKVLEKYTEV